MANFQMGKFEIRGLKDVIANIRREAKVIEQNLVRRNREAAKKVLDNCNTNYAPKDDGDLQASGRVERQKREGDTIIAAVVYGGPDVPQAVPTHETPSKYDPPSWEGKTVNFQPPGTSKYLEHALNDAEIDYLEQLAGKK